MEPPESNATLLKIIRSPDEAVRPKSYLRGIPVIGFTSFRVQSDVAWGILARMKVTIMDIINGLQGCLVIPQKKLALHSGWNARQLAYSSTLDNVLYPSSFHARSPYILFPPNIAHEIIATGSRQLPAGDPTSPDPDRRRREAARRRFIEFFSAKIRNAHTRKAYLHAVSDFCRCSNRSPVFDYVSPMVVAGYIETLSQTLRSRP